MSIYKHRMSVIRRIVLLVFFIAIVGCVGMMLTFWLAQSIYGNAHTINRAGSLRMLSYKALSYVPMSENPQGLESIQQFDHILNDARLIEVIQQEQMMPLWQSLQTQWQQRVRSQLLHANSKVQIHHLIDEFVIQIDQVVYKLDQKTENRLIYTGNIQRFFLVFILFCCFMTLFYLYRRFILPWRQINAIIAAIRHQDFNQRFVIRSRRKDELATLGYTLNRMCDELSRVYADLEHRVQVKTQALELKNRFLSFLYCASCALNSDSPLCSRVTPIINELPSILPFSTVKLRIYESQLNDQFYEFGDLHQQRPSYCHKSECHGCFSCASPAASLSTNSQLLAEKEMCWKLEDNAILYGLLIVSLPKNQQLDDDQHQLLMTLVELLTNSLVLERQIARNQQLLLLEERSTIASELHDSLAQSLSCMKFQLGCIHMQHHDLPAPVEATLLELKQEINNAYHQLRDLLTHFRLKLVEPSLYASLQMVITEFEQRLGFPIEFDYQVPVNHLNSHQIINLIQISREALMNIVKHAHASWAKVQMGYQQHKLMLMIEDNGKGISCEKSPDNHYGLIIMKDRATNMGGTFSITARQQGGTQILVSLALTNKDNDNVV